MELLHHHSGYAFYRGTAPSDHKKVLLKIPLENAALDDAEKAFAHELQMAERLDTEWALHPLRMGSSEEGPFIVFDDGDGTPLDSTLFPFKIETFLTLASAAVRAVQAMHAEGILHLNLKPRNLIVSNPSSSPSVRLTGFSIATPRESLPQTDLLKGTLAYMSPEQTGHLSYRADERSDLYSLGILFYQMLTGTLPFAASDALGWMLCHVAVEPMPLNQRNEQIPPALAAIVAKLLMKDPEDRYRTAFGLQSDLERALKEWQQSEWIEPFPLGKCDVSEHFHIPDRLYGRDEETAELHVAYTRVAEENASEFVLLTGSAGTGKTALVDTIIPDVLSDKGFFSSGKFDQFKRDTPYSVLIQAGQKLLQDLLADSPESLDIWKTRLLKALNGHGRVLADVLPKLDLVIGEQPLVAPLAPQEAQNRWVRTFKDFLGVFARPGRPLTLFLDDLHWADTGSLDLLQQIFIDPPIPHLLVLGAYRDNEVEPGHPLFNTLIHLEQSGAPLHTVHMEPILPVDVERWIADTLASDVEEVRPLAEIISMKTDCNPFFVIQFLQNLYREHLITLDEDARRWVWNLKAIKERQFTDNVVDFLVRRLEKISPALREVLQVIALIGSRISLATLARLTERSAEDLEPLLREGGKENLLHLLPDAVEFVHDHVQQAAYGLIPPDDVPSLHLRMGRLFIKETPVVELDEVIFDIANQFLPVPEEMIASEERRQIASLCLHAGLKAKSSAAFRAAIPYLSKALALLPEKTRWETDYETAYEIASRLALCEYCAGNSQEAIALCTETIDRARTAEDQAKLYSTLINILTTRGEMEEAVRRGVEGLALLGMDVAIHPDEETVEREIARITENLDGRAVGTMTELPLMSDPRMLRVTEILSELLTPALFFNRPFFHYGCALTLNISLQHGIAPGTPWAATLFGALYLVRSDVGRYHDGHDFAKAGNDLVNQHDLVSNKARVMLVFGDTARSYTCPLRSNAPYLKAAFDTAIEYGDLVWGAYACNHKITNMLAIGEPLSQVWEESLWRRTFVQRLGDENIDQILLSQQCFVRSMQGETEQLGSFSHDGFSEEEFEQNLATSQMFLMVCWYYIIKGRALYLANRYEEAYEAFQHAEPLLWTSPTDLQITEYHFYLALTRLALGKPADELHAQLTVWAENCAENFAQMRDLVGAETARAEGRLLDAEGLYERAIEAAHASGFIHDEALAYERAARFYQERGLTRFATQYLREARRGYRAWGAEGKAQQLETLFPQLGTRPVQLLEGRAHLDTVALHADQIDLLSVIKATQSISSQMREEPLIDQLLAIVLEGACALHAYLLLPSDEDWRVAAHTALVEGAPTPQHEEQAALRARLPDAVINEVLHSKEVVLIDDASQSTRFSESFTERTARSVLAMPIIKQDELIAVIYLENKLVRGAFTPDRLTFIEIVALQSAISLDNARLYEVLRKKETLLADSQKIAQLGSWELDAVTHHLSWTDEVYRIFGLKPQEFPATYKAFLECVHPEDRAAVDAAFTNSLRDGKDGYKIDHRIIQRNTEEVRMVHEECVHHRNPEGRVIRSAGSVQDITDRQQAEEKRLLLEDQLNQSRKMEVVGQLAGGVAHDFNNILQSIMGHTQLASEKVDPEDPVRKNLDEVQKAADHAKDLTRQLLTFSSTQSHDPSVLDLNESIQKMLKMLRPLIGENIHTAYDLGTDLWPVYLDPVQVDQILANLSLNARDAIDGVGKMSVVTTNCHVDESSRVSHDGAPPGDYVVLEITDNGCGIDAETQKKIFEPFFTTKDMGKGTGLGLATVYGIVQQNGGHIGIHSEVGKGTSILIYLPRHEGESINTALPVPTDQVEKGCGTVLLVEDNPAVLDLGTQMLNMLGYTVLPANSPKEALQIAEEHADSIQLLLTDVIMPGMNGRKLADILKAHMPNLKLLFMSGYTADVLGKHDGKPALAAGSLLPKPFSMEQLAEKVRDVMSG